MVDNRHHVPLHLLAASSTTTALDAARNLLASGESACVKSDDGITPLHVACAYDCLAMVQLLMHYGANPLAEDNSGRTPYSLATGNTQRFLERVLAKSTREQRGIIRRLFACHSVAKEGTKRKPFMENIRRRIRRSLNVILMKPHLGALTTEVPTRSTVSTPSRDQPTFHSALPGYPIIDRMPQPSLYKTRCNTQGFSTPSSTSRPKACPSLNVSEQSTSRHFNDKNCASATRKSRSSTFAEGNKSDDSSGWLSENDNTRETQDTVFLSADESFDFAELQKRLEQIRIVDPVITPYVDDGQLRKVRRLNDEQLKAELKKVGIIAGPICARTRRMYEKKLVTMRREMDATKGVRYSRQLELTIVGKLSSENGKALDDKVREEFKLHGVNAFCYLLLDPRKITDSVESLDLKGFIPSIFYVGKGSKVRPFAHLIEAKKEKNARSPKLVSNAKLQRINSIWDSGNGVVCLQIYHNISDDEAFVREAALIDAIRLENLTNMKAGEYRGKSKSWTLPMKAEFGTYQLERARSVLKVEGIRPIMPQALPESLFPYVPKRI
uniref:LEM domain-containing protein n=1 Tax=Angiostrongylus cantonensis TaxID=6313 RepID=A0A0K0D0A2_ANGCA